MYYIVDQEIDTGLELTKFSATAIPFRVRCWPVMCSSVQWAIKLETD
jgi:hypothetical protein